MTGSNQRAARLRGIPVTPPRHRGARPVRRCSPGSPASCSPINNGAFSADIGRASCSRRSSPRCSAARCWPAARSACSARSSAPRSPPGHLQGAEPAAVRGRQAPDLHRRGAAARAVARPGQARAGRAAGGEGMSTAPRTRCHRHRGSPVCGCRAPHRARPRRPGRAGVRRARGDHERQHARGRHPASRLPVPRRPHRHRPGPDGGARRRPDEPLGRRPDRSHRDGRRGTDGRRRLVALARPARRAARGCPRRRPQRRRSWWPPGSTASSSRWRP